MALTACRSCGHEVSERAVSCPSCGEPHPVSAVALPLSAQQRLIGAAPPWALVLGALVVVAFLALVLVAQINGMS